jgi:hypothetical protein
MQRPLPGLPWWLPSMRGALQRCERRAVEGIALTGSRTANAVLSGTCKGWEGWEGWAATPLISVSGALMTTPQPRTRALRVGGPVAEILALAPAPAGQRASLARDFPVGCSLLHSLICVGKYSQLGSSRHISVEPSNQHRPFDWRSPVAPSPWTSNRGLGYSGRFLLASATRIRLRCDEFQAESCFPA